MDKILDIRMIIYLVFIVGAVLYIQNKHSTYLSQIIKSEFKSLTGKIELNSCFHLEMPSESTTKKDKEI